MIQITINLFDNSRAREHHDAILAQAEEEGWGDGRIKKEGKKIQHFKLLNFFIWEFHVLRSVFRISTVTLLIWFKVKVGIKVDLRVNS